MAFVPDKASGFQNVMFPAFGIPADGGRILQCVAFEQLADESTCLILFDYSSTTSFSPGRWLPEL
jgi:hypothetical protein